MNITANITSPIKVEFKQFIFEDDFVEEGMHAYLTHVEYADEDECYKLFFDFSEFFDHNQPLFEETYYPNKHTDALNLDKDMYTAIEAGCYQPQYSVYFSLSSNTKDNDLFKKEILDYLKII